MRPSTALTLAAALALSAGCAGEESDRAPHPFLDPDVTPADVQERVTQFAPTEIDFDASLLDADQKAVVRTLVEASMVLDSLFLRQVHPENPEWRRRLVEDEGAGKEAALAYFDIMYGPWDRLEDDEPFLEVGPKPPGAGYYPEGLTKEHFESWLEVHPQDRDAFTSYYTVIRRDADSLVAVPYADAYRSRLERAAALLREAADAASNASLAGFLRLRADAFLSNDYLESEMAWMDIEGSRIEPTIGPYEVYEDELLGYKVAFESFITISDPEASAELDVLKDRLPGLEAALPIPDEHKNTGRGFESPMRVVDVAYTAGDTRAGVQTIAFNLPNDERVREAKGSKKVMLRNVSRAKFDQILTPIAGTLLAEEIAGEARFDPWFTAVLMHELAHGIGPGFITLSSGEETTVSQALQERYSAIEEAKADVVGLHSLTVLAEEGLYDDAFVRSAFASHVADYFRAVRFGATEAHGRANLIEFNWMREKGVVSWDGDAGTFSADIDGMIAANRELASEILMIEARGSYEDAGRLIDEYGTIPPELETAIDALSDVPVDIRPRYTVLEKMEAW